MHAIKSGFESTKEAFRSVSESHRHFAIDLSPSPLFSTIWISVINLYLDSSLAETSVFKCFWVSVFRSVIVDALIWEKLNAPRFACNRVSRNGEICDESILFLIDGLMSRDWSCSSEEIIQKPKQQNQFLLSKIIYVSYCAYWNCWPLKWNWPPPKP